MHDTRRTITTDGVHLRRDGVPWRIRGVTYGTFLARQDGACFPRTARVHQDMRAIARAGLNTVRTYTPPPGDVLDAAAEAGLHVICGVHHEDWRTRPDATAAQVRASGIAAVREALAVAAEHPATLAVCVGNEVPADLVRVVGARTVERVLSALVAEVHRLAPGLLTTYASYPSTEYLRVDGLDLASFNVFLDDPEDLRRYLRRLQVQVGDIPLLLSEVGVPGEVHGEAGQAAHLARQLRVADEVGIAGACVFSWTDEWGVAGEPVEGWGFGITRASRSEKLAVREVREWALRDTDDLRGAWPSVSVVVCAFNEEATIRECLASLAACEYPALEVLVCDDGSTDATLRLARTFEADPRIRVLALPHGGLSAARNAGLAAATGEIVAYLDADAACHPHWVHHLALSLEDPAIAATGGPNLPVDGAGFVERVVATCPGAPQHVLASHDRAEHVPGCNMAFRAAALRSVGGFDVAYTAAGDDVDVCWKLQDRGLAIGFAPAAMVRHHRRATVRGYLRQQRGYGRSERMLSGPHAHRFNRAGQARWGGVIYGNPLRRLLRPVVYHGAMGTAAYQPATRLRGQAALDWVGALLPLAAPVGLAGLVGTAADPRWALLSLLAAVVMVAYGVAAAIAVVPARGEPHARALRALAGVLHVVQPFVRTWGRLRGRRLPPAPQARHPRWTGERLDWLARLTAALRAQGLHVRQAGPTDDHDLVAARTPLVQGRVAAAVLWRWTPVARVRLRPRPAAAGLLALGLLAGISSGALAVAAAVAAVLVVAAGLDAAGLRRRARRAVAAAASQALAVDPPTRHDVMIDLTDSPAPASR